MFGTELRNLYSTIRCIHNTLLHTLHLVAKHYGIAFPGSGDKILQCNAALAKLNGIDSVTLATQSIDSIHRRPEIAPLHHILGTKGRLVYLGTGRCRRYAAQHNALHAESIARAEHGTYIMQATHIVKYHNQGHLLGLGKRIAVNAPHLRHKFLSVHANLLQSTFLISPSRSYAVCMAKVAARLCDR